MFTNVKSVVTGTVLSKPELDDENILGVYNVWLRSLLPGKNPRMALSLLHFAGVNDEAKLQTLMEKWQPGSRMYIEGEPMFQINDIDENGIPATNVGNPIIRGDVNDEGGLFCGYDLLVHMSSVFGKGSNNDIDAYRLFGVGMVTKESTLVYRDNGDAMWNMSVNVPRWTRNFKSIPNYKGKVEDPMNSPRWLRLSAYGKKAEEVAKKGVIAKGEYVWFEGDPSTDKENSGYILPYARKDAGHEGEMASSYSIWVDTFRLKHAVVEKLNTGGGTYSDESNESDIPF